MHKAGTQDSGLFFYVSYTLFQIPPVETKTANSLAAGN